MRRRGITLGEILVAATILLILGALIFPVYAAARRRGYIPQSIAQLRSISAAQEMYASDWGEYALQRNGGPYFWPEMIRAYFPSIWRLRPPLYRRGPFPEFTIGYWMNECLASSYGRRGSIADAARTVLAAESASFGCYLEGTLGGCGIWESVAPDPTMAAELRSAGVRISVAEPFAARWYDGRGVYVMVDGHAASLREEQFSIAPRVPIREVCTRTRAGPPIPANAFLYARTTY